MKTMFGLGAAEATRQTKVRRTERRARMGLLMKPQ
jgi:hypothetical protein